MKRLISALIISIFSLGLLCSCGTTDTSTNTVPPSGTATPTSSAPTATPKPTDTILYTIKNEVVVDTEYCSFAIMSAEEDHIWGPTLKVLCENKTEGQTLMFSVDDVSVNGYMVDPFWSSSVAAGKKDSSSISFSHSSLQENGLTSLDEVEFSLRIYDYDDWTADHLIDQRFTVYPTGMTADQIKIPPRPSGDKELIVVDNSDCLFVILNHYDDSIWGYSLSCYLENRSDKDLMFTWDDVSVNDFMFDPFWAETVSAGKRSISDINFSDSRLEEIGVEEIKSIEFRLKVYDSNDWVADHLVDNVFQYNP